MSEKASQQILPALDRVGSAAGSVRESPEVEGGIVRERIGLEPGPQIFDRIELGSVRRKVFQVC